jgi:hypothetical protein
MERVFVNKKGDVLKIIQDDNSESPREWNNLGTMSCFHNRYNLGDKDPIVSTDDYNSWDEMKEALIKEHNAKIVLPLYLYDHSGITISTSPFTCRWDSGQVGFIWISAEKIRKEYSVKRISQKLLEKVETYLRAEVKTYDQYFIGDIYGFELYDKDENLLDSCWGFYGDDIKENGMIDHFDFNFEDFEEK